MVNAVATSHERHEVPDQAAGARALGDRAGDRPSLFRLDPGAAEHLAQRRLLGEEGEEALELLADLLDLDAGLGRALE